MAFGNIGKEKLDYLFLCSKVVFDHAQQVLPLFKSPCPYILIIPATHSLLLLLSPP